MRPFIRSKPDIDAAYRQYADMLYRVALAQLSSDADAQDAVQDVFIKYMSVSPAFEGSEHEQAWFLRATVNRCHDIIRRRKIRDALPLEEAHHVAAREPDTLTGLMQLLERLPPRLRETVILHHLEGFPLEKTASILGISLSAAKMRMLRAREALQKLLDKEDGDVYR